MARYTTTQVIHFTNNVPSRNILRSGEVLVEQWDGVEWITVETLSTGSDMYKTGDLSLRFTPSDNVAYTIDME